jgi:Ca2+-binding EF-hand superfamily protein
MSEDGASPDLGQTSVSKTFSSVAEKTMDMQMRAKSMKSILMNHGERKELPGHRETLHQFLRHPATEVFLAMIIAFNVYCVIEETNCNANQVVNENGLSVGPTLTCPAFLDLSNTLILVFYFCEVCFRLHVYRLDFFKDSLGVLDMSIVLVDVLILVVGNLLQQEATPLMSVLRVARLVRLSRSVKLMMLAPELNMLVRGLLGALRAIFWGVLMIIGILTIFGIVAVQLIHDVNLELVHNGFWEQEGCTRCPHAFESVQESVLTFTQQLIAGDSWGTVTVPIIEARPITFWFFMSVLALVSLAIMNLILAVIVEQATQMKQESLMELAKAKEAERDQHKEDLFKICEGIDLNKNGVITMDEIHYAFCNDPHFVATMVSMDISMDEMSLVYDMMDEDGSGDVEYHEFVDQLCKLKSLDTQTTLFLVKYNMNKMKLQFDSYIKYQEQANGIKYQEFDEDLHKDRRHSKTNGAGKMAEEPQDGPGRGRERPEEKKAASMELLSVEVPAVYIEQLRKADEELRTMAQRLSEASMDAFTQLQQALDEIKRRPLEIMLARPSCAPADDSLRDTTGRYPPRMPTTSSAEMPAVEPTYEHQRGPAPPEDDVWLSVSWALEEEGNGRRGHSVPEDARWTAGATREGQARRGGPAQAVSKDDARRVAQTGRR